MDKEEGAKDKMAKVIAGAIHRMQTAFAGYMNRLTGGQPVATLKAGLLVFVTVSTILSVRCIWGAAGKYKTRMFQTGRMQAPRYEEGQPRGIITRREQEKIKWFQHYLDSLQQTQPGQQVYDSLRRVRPGLVDSLSLLEQIYQQPVQNKK